MFPGRRTPFPVCWGMWWPAASATASISAAPTAWSTPPAPAPWGHSTWPCWNWPPTGPILVLFRRSGYDQRHLHAHVLLPHPHSVRKRRHPSLLRRSRRYVAGGRHRHGGAETARRGRTRPRPDLCGDQGCRHLQRWTFPEHLRTAGGRPEKALSAAYHCAGFSPGTVELVEAHGTGTRVGDQVEFTALKEVFQKTDASNTNHPPTLCALGSVKSQIGHTKAAAGSAGLIKTALSLFHKTLPPTLKATSPDPELEVTDSPFYINTTIRPWLSHPDHPRRAGVSAFGFGGSNYHMVLEEYGTTKTGDTWDGSVEIIALSGQTPEAVRVELERLLDAIEKDGRSSHLAWLAAETRQAFDPRLPVRLAFPMAMTPPHSSDKMAQLKLRQAIELVGRTSDPPASTELERIGIYFSCDPDPPGPLCFLFPGQGSQYVGMGRDLVCRFATAFATIEAANHRFDGPERLSDLIWPAFNGHSAEQVETAGRRLRDTRIAQPAIGAVSLAMATVLADFGLKPQSCCGHSFGELTALCAAGRIGRDDFLELALLRGRLMAAPPARGRRRRSRNNAGL
jgi:acyl transferase domain-containing protein